MAVSAAGYLDAIASMETRIARLDQDERLQMIATGGYATVNADYEWTVKLSIANSLAAIAMCMTDELEEVEASRDDEGEEARAGGPE